MTLPTYRPFPTYEPFSEKAWTLEWPISWKPTVLTRHTSYVQGAKYGVSSKRVDTLAMPKQHAPGFVPDRPINTIVSKNAKRASMTERLELLAKAKDQ